MALKRDVIDRYDTSTLHGSLTLMIDAKGQIASRSSGEGKPGCRPLLEHRQLPRLALPGRLPGSIDSLGQGAALLPGLGTRAAPLLPLRWPGLGGAGFAARLASRLARAASLALGGGFDLHQLVLGTPSALVLSDSFHG